MLISIAGTILILLVIATTSNIIMNLLLLIVILHFQLVFRSVRMAIIAVIP